MTDFDTTTLAGDLSEAERTRVLAVLVKYARDDDEVQVFAEMLGVA